jgi:hypothetical protein
MIRDNVMKALIEKEPITPFTDRVRELSGKGVSTILVIGGSGEYLSVADKIYRMDNFVMEDITNRAKEIAKPAEEPIPEAQWENRRNVYSGGFTSYPENSGTEKLTVSDTGFFISMARFLDLPRKYELYAAINRMRGVERG